MKRLVIHEADCPVLCQDYCLDGSEYGPSGPHAAEAIASVDYRDDSMKVKRIYTAWDNMKDEARLFAGLEALCRHGVKPDEIMVYMLIGYWPGESAESRDHRRAALRRFGCRPYPMPYVRTQELVGFQRWVIGAYDKRIPWGDWVAAKFEPRNLDRLAIARQGFGGIDAKP